uniref:Uncharacterized protein n=1 Tax=Arundo donax TaxID=35708 RepID=A0A0A9C4U0_ARUDO
MQFNSEAGLDIVKNIIVS